MFTTTTVTRVRWQPSTGADTERAGAGGLHQHHTRVGSSQICGRTAAAAQGLLRECELLLPAPLPVGRQSQDGAPSFQAGTRGSRVVANQPTLTPGAPALVVEISTTNVLHRPWLVVGAPPPSEVCPRRCRRPRGACLKVGTPRGSRAVVLVPAPTPGAPSLSGIHISTTDVVERRRLVAGAPPQPCGTRGV